MRLVGEGDAPVIAGRGVNLLVFNSAEQQKQNRACCPVVTTS